MSAIINLATLSDKDLKKLVSEYISLRDIYDEFEEYGRPVLLYKEPGEECTRESDEGLEVIAENWRDLRRRLKPIIKDIEEERSEEKKRNIYLEGIRETVTPLVDTLKMNMDTSGDPRAKKSDPAVNNKPKLLTKPAKVLVWTKDLTLGTYIKQVLS